MRRHKKWPIRKDRPSCENFFSALAVKRSPTPYALLTFSAQGPLGLWPFVNSTESPSRRSSNAVSQPLRWKKRSGPSVPMKPKPLSSMIFLMVPWGMIFRWNVFLALPAPFGSPIAASTFRPDIAKSLSFSHGSVAKRVSPGSCHHHRNSFHALFQKPITIRRKSG